MRFAQVCAAAALAFGLALAPALAMDTNNAFESRPSVNELYKKAQKAVELNRFRDAVADLQALLKERPSHADALNLLGFSHRKLKEYDLSVSYYQKALAADPKHRGAHEYLGEAYLEQGNLPEAEARLARLTELCGADCKETQALAQAVAAYKAGKRPPQSSRANW